MSDRNTMYRVDAEPDIAAWLIETQVLVEVVPCVHGNYARHIVGYGERMNTFAMCDGVGEGDSDAVKRLLDSTSEGSTVYGVDTTYEVIEVGEGTE